MGLHRIGLAHIPGLNFWKLLGTGRGETFTLNDADSHHWALLTVWDSLEQARSFQQSIIALSWNRIASESGYVVMQSISSHGEWSGCTPFSKDPHSVNEDAPIAVITRARIKPRMWKTFYRAVEPVATDLVNRSDVPIRFGIGEAPIGLQGTFSIWRNSQAIRNFAYNSPAHKNAIKQTQTLQWYSEELFARFSIIEAFGSINGKALETIVKS
jgi:heme-degrading monooxygenase HmoA